MTQQRTQAGGRALGRWRLLAGAATVRSSCALLWHGHLPVSSHALTGWSRSALSSCLWLCRLHGRVHCARGLLLQGLFTTTTRPGRRRFRLRRLLLRLLLLRRPCLQRPLHRCHVLRSIRQQRGGVALVQPQLLAQRVAA